MTRRRVTGEVRLRCRWCGSGVTLRPDVDPSLCWKCYVTELRKAEAKHGPVCYVCANFCPSLSRGGLGLCRYTGRDVNVSGSCKKGFKPKREVFAKEAEEFGDEG